MIALAATILVSSVAGSLHCVAMCGPLINLSGSLSGSLSGNVSGSASGTLSGNASGTLSGNLTASRPGRARMLRLAGVHALGRLTTYTVLGALAGLIGRAVDLAGQLATAQHVAALVAGGAIVLWGVRAIAIAWGWLQVRSGGGALFQRGLSQLRGRRAVTRAWFVGVLTGFLPCGWLWAFVVSAAGTASPVAGAAVMATFWLGTVPAMTGVLALGGPLIDRIRRRMPVVSACVLITLGLATIAVRWHDAGAIGVTAPHCHGAT